MSQSAPPIHQEVVFEASPSRVYDALTDAARFSEFSGGAEAEIDAVAGGGFSAFGGMIVGRIVDLVPNERIVQAWRVSSWEAGVYSIARFDLQPSGQGTRLIFDQAGFPSSEVEHLEAGWTKMYWEPLQKYLR